MYNNLQSLTFSSDFFEDEVREGFFVPSIMKRFWAAQLTVLSEIDIICRKHDISWFADWGTLLGAIRHQGFIPWDDDIDISMLREDYEEFLRVAPFELPEGYQIITAELSDESDNSFCRITNSHSVNWSQERLTRFHGCPFCVGIDLFPLDGFSNDNSLEIERQVKVQHINDAIRHIHSGNLYSPEYVNLLQIIEQENQVTLSENQNPLRVLKLTLNDLYASFSAKESSDIALMYYWFDKQKGRFPRKLFDKIQFVPFENFLLPVPGEYEKVLDIEFGQWKTPVISGGSHHYPLYIEQENEYRQITGHNLLRFTITPTLLSDCIQNTSLSDQYHQILLSIRKIHPVLQSAIESREVDSIHNLLLECQSAAIAVGTSMEEHGTDFESTIHDLEAYCEQLYQISTTACDRADISPADRIIDKILEDFSRKKVLILPYRSKWWNSLSGIWRRYTADPLCQVTVMPLPYELQTGEYGKYCRYDDSLLFPQNIVITPPSESRIIDEHPDIIVIQYPYDRWGDFMKIPEFYDASNLRQYTKELIYIPFLEPINLSSSNEKQINALIPFLETPAVLYADTILLGSPGLRNLFIDGLTQITGSDTSSFWNQKIKLDQDLFSI